MKQVSPFLLRLTEQDAQEATDDWGFNCGPGALCAILNLTPSELRPFLGEFESKGYTNPTLLLKTLSRCEAKFQSVFRNDDESWTWKIPELQNALVRVQWSGPWVKPGVPMLARYRQTHWIAVRGKAVFDINAIGVGGWLPFETWSNWLAPWLIKECIPKGDGKWWPTHGIEVEPK